jgi:hypothetical protein
MDWSSVCRDAFVLIRASDDGGGRARSKLLLRSRGGGCGAEQLLAETRAEAAAAAAAAGLLRGARLRLVGQGTLFNAGSGRLRVVPCVEPPAGGASARAMAPAGVAALAAALLRQAAPADWTVLE